MINWFTTFSVFWWIGGIIMFGLFIWAIIATLQKNGDRPPPGKNPTLDLLKKKFDFGEIDGKEFKEKVNEIM